jgi:hypothetical protein
VASGSERKERVPHGKNNKEKKNKADQTEYRVGLPERLVRYLNFPLIQIFCFGVGQFPKASPDIEEDKAERMYSPNRNRTMNTTTHA